MNYRKNAEKHAENSFGVNNGRMLAESSRRKRPAETEKLDVSASVSINPCGNYEYEQMLAEKAILDVHRMIAEAAFFIAEKRGFASGNEDSDWFQAEDSLRKAPCRS